MILIGHKMSRMIVATVCLTLMACSSTTPDASSDASVSPDAPATDSTCELTAKGCLIFRCNCTDGRTTRTFADKAGGGCLSGVETCGQICQVSGSSVVTPVSCNKAEVLDASVTPGPDAADAGPKKGRSGGECETRGPACVVASCECKNGTIQVNGFGICKAGICASLTENCEKICVNDGGYSGTGEP